jgi:hypothetical protein
VLLQMGSWGAATHPGALLLLLLLQAALLQPHLHRLGRLLQRQRG